MCYEQVVDHISELTRPGYLPPPLETCWQDRPSELVIFVLDHPSQKPVFKLEMSPRVIYSLCLWAISLKAVVEA